MNAAHVAQVQGLCRYIEANLEAPLTLAALGKRAGLSPAHLQRVFKSVTGDCGGKRFAVRRRLRVGGDQ